MTTLQLFPKQTISTLGPTVFKTERNQHEIHCGMCGRIIYVEEESFDFFNEAIKAGLDEPFRCELCKDSDDLAYAG